MAATMKNAIFWDVSQCGSCNDVSEEYIASIIRVNISNELRRTLGVTSSTGSFHPDGGSDTLFRNVSSYTSHTVSYSR
jgi:hypothetical protein